MLETSESSGCTGWVLFHFHVARQIALSVREHTAQDSWSGLDLAGRVRPPPLFFDKTPPSKEEEDQENPV